MNPFSFYKDKKVFVSGHTGFKGTWLCKMLMMAGADVTGYALRPPTTPNLFDIVGVETNIKSVIGDVRDKDFLAETMKCAKPDIVFHMAAQPIVRKSYIDPVYTYETNVMGTVNLLECIRESENIKSVVNITTDKVYDNKEFDRGYVEEDFLDGYDPYSNSKSCSELVTHSYKRSFLNECGISVSTVRAGNVIGGGDFAKDRILPDCVRAAKKGEDIIVRNPHSTRPYQHVLEPLSAYLMIAEKQYFDIKYSDSYNVGPNDVDCITTGEIVSLFCSKWGEINWVIKGDGGPHEAKFLKLNCNKIKEKIGWHPTWNIGMALDKIVEWTKAYQNNENINVVMENQIKEFYGVKYGKY